MPAAAATLAASVSVPVAPAHAVRIHGLELARKIFVPFFTTRGDGSGVGLAFSRQVMIAHGGTISYAPADGGGARFTLTF